MVDIRNCERCGKAFMKNAPLQKLCPQCVRLEDEEFVKVKEHLFRRPEASLEEIEQQLQVPRATILRFMQSGRLTVKNTGLTCDVCGKPIEKGTMCPACQSSLVRDLQRVQGRHEDPRTK